MTRWIFTWDSPPFPISAGNPARGQGAGGIWFQKGNPPCNPCDLIFFFFFFFFFLQHLVAPSLTNDANLLRVWWSDRGIQRWERGWWISGLLMEWREWREFIQSFPANTVAVLVAQLGNLVCCRIQLCHFSLQCHTPSKVPL